MAAVLRKTDTVNGVPVKVHQVYRGVVLVGRSMAHINWR